MADPGGFEHNLQSLRVVDRLEQRYPAFDGLNLCLETREGILKHCSARVAAQLEAAEPGGVARRFVLRQQPSLEAQLVNLADEMAYNAHDIDDGVRPACSRRATAAVLLHAMGRGAIPALRGSPAVAGRVLRRMLSKQVLT
jgi:dGTPase